MTPFTISCPTDIRFGTGRVADLVGVLPDGPVVLVQGGSGVAAAPVRHILQAQAVTPLTITCAGEPSVADVNSARDAVVGARPELVIACGGGAVMDLGKALAFVLSHDLDLTDDFTDLDPALTGSLGRVPCFALPTTAGTGAEVTANAVLDVPSKGAKISLRGRGLFPQLAIVDPDLLRSAPQQVLLHSGLDAVTQVMEAHTSVAATAFTTALTSERLLPGLQALRAMVEAPDETARTQIAWTALSSGLALANGGLGAAHGMASVLGAELGAPHGALCGRLLGPVLRRNLACAASGSQAHRRIDQCCAAIAQVFEPTDPGDALSGFDIWLSAHSLPRLADWGLAEAEIVATAQKTVQASSSRKNAVPLHADDHAVILCDAF